MRSWQVAGSKELTRGLPVGQVVWQEALKRVKLVAQLEQKEGEVQWVQPTGHLAATGWFVS